MSFLLMDQRTYFFATYTARLRLNDSVSKMIVFSIYGRISSNNAIKFLKSLIIMR